MLYFSASGGFSPGHCSPSNDTIPWISETWTPENEPLFKTNLSPSTSISPPYLHYQPYQPNEAQVHAFRNKTNAFCEENNAVSRFSGGLGMIPLTYVLSYPSVCILTYIYIPSLCIPSRYYTPRSVQRGGRPWIQRLEQFQSAVSKRFER